MIHLADLLTANPEARVVGPRFATSFDSFCFDSRLVQPGQLFLAVKTERADGHDYAAGACLGGATGVLCQRPLDVAAHGATCVVVPDTQEAILRWARHMVRALGPRIVAVTGSVGKTTTKELLAHVLGACHHVFRNPANYSGRFGLPIALGGLRAEHDVAVLEMATDQFGEIALQADIAPPEVACVTRVAAAHLDALGDLEGVAREKGALIEALAPEGVAVLNGDDPRVRAMAAGAPDGAEIVLCSSEGGAPAGGARGPDDPTPSDAEPDRDPDGGPWRLLARDLRLDRRGTTMVVEGAGAPLPVRIPWLGRHFALGAMMALAVGRRFGMSAQEVRERLASLPPVAGRLRPLPGRGGALILDDTYNASPAAALAALEVLDEVAKEAAAAGRGPDEEEDGGAETPVVAVAVLGDMAELGDAAEEAHRRVGQRASEVVDLLVTCGEKAVGYAEGARAAGMDPEHVVVTHRTEDAVAAIEPLLSPRTIVLAKGSAVTRMEQVVEALMAEPERAPELLVRQDAAWRQIVVLRPERPTWLEIDLGAVAHNTQRLKARAGGAELMAVIKADAYGHGGEQVARTALHNGASWLGVACLPEGAALRKAGIDEPVLVLGYTPAWQAREAVRLGLDVAVYERDTARALSRAAVALDGRARLHVKVDTGLRRLGVAPERAASLVRDLSRLERVDVVGVFSHLAVADELEEASRAATARQLERFASVLEALEEAGLRPPVAHLANSAALLTLPAARHDLVRPGIALYGLQPSTEVRDPELRPALSWKTQVAQVRQLAPGAAVGYGRTWAAERPSRVATIPVGYADGFRRAPRRWHHVLIRGQAAPLVGRVSMDQATVDVTDVPDVRQGDEVVLIGRQGEVIITAEQVAAWLGTIHYEVVSAILARVSRVS